MNPKEINETIAEFCGTLKWRQRISSGFDVDYLFSHSKDTLLKKVAAHEREGLGAWAVDGEPEAYNSINYFEDLNAMHEAEKKLDDVKQNRMADSLRGVLGFHSHSYFDLMHATARQRAEAFLRTIGKWKESQPPK
jgi:hypothetical protein